MVMFIHSLVEKVSLYLVSCVVHKYAIEDFTGAVFSFELN